MTSFEFSFNKNPNPVAGKVFARKRKVNVEKPESEKTQIIATKQAVNNVPRKSFKKKIISNNGPAKQSFNDSSTLVKRKKNKDKLNAAANKDKDQATENSLQKSTHSLFSEKHKSLYINVNTKGKSLVETVFSKSEQSFSDLNIHKYLVSNLEKINFTTLTTVQEKSIPLVLEGKNVLIRSQTGSGKTLTYAVPILNALQNVNPKLQRSDGVQAIIIVPTRELALQTHELFSKINTFQWIVVGHLCGGENRKTEKVRLRKGVHVLIGTPGRLLDHILHTTAFKTNNVHYLVLDEADRLLDMGFKRDIETIVDELNKSRTNSSYNPMEILKQGSNIDESKSEIEIQRQTILLSATLTKAISELADFTMKDHIYIDALDNNNTSMSNPSGMVIPHTVKQEFIVTYVKHRLLTLSALLVAKSKQNNCKLFVFMATSQMVDYHYELFTKHLVKMPVNRGKMKIGDVVVLNEDLDSDDDEEIVLDVDFFKLHGSMDQSTRKEVFTKFKATKKGILICTDVAARGLDIPEADTIIQYTGPQSDEDYLHRVGRTGRAGKSGSAIIFLTHEEQEFITRLQSHRVYLKERKPEELLKHLCDLMEEPDEEKAATTLQKHFENVVGNDKSLQKMACFAYSSWSRFYNTYPSTMKTIFDFKRVNLGHYVTSFALKITPTEVSRIVRGQVGKVEPKRLNKKLAIHENEEPSKVAKKRKIKSVSLTTSEFGSGMEPTKKKNKKN